MRRILIACALALLSACSPSAADAPITEQWRALDLTITPVELGADRIGHLRFRGGLHLQAGETPFGGLSGLEVLEDGRLVAIADDGRWFEARLALDESGALIGLTSPRIAMMRDERGEPFANKEDGDSEGLAQLPDGRFAVSFEQNQRVLIYDLNRDGPFGAAIAGPALEDARRLRDNVGLEAIAAAADAALLVGAEGFARRATPLWLAPLNAQAPAPRRTDYPLTLGYALTGLDHAPDGGFVALERFYAPVIGARARITRFPDAALGGQGETLANVELLAELAPPLAVDNFEGIAAVRAPDGGVRLYLVSDNNFRTSQRTLLLAFDVVE